MFLSSCNTEYGDFPLPVSEEQNAFDRRYSVLVTFFFFVNSTLSGMERGKKYIQLDENGTFESGPSFTK